jgi:uncharacterized membrane protein
LYPAATLAIPVFAAMSLVASALPASAKFAVCNRTATPASVALGFFDGKDWASAGWWKLAAGECSALVKEPLMGRFYYLYAEHQDSDGAWDGDRSFCVKQRRFTIQGRRDCSAHGYELKRFFQVDTGNSVDWTENLAD